MDKVKEIVQQAKQLPIGAMNDALCQIYKSYADKQQLLLDKHYNDILIPLSSFGTSTADIKIQNVQEYLSQIKQNNVLQQTTTALQQLINNYVSNNSNTPASASLLQRYHPNLRKINQARLFTHDIQEQINKNKTINVIQIVNQIIQSNKLPSFTPLMSEFPNIQPLKELLINPEQESDLSFFNFKIQQQPYTQYIQKIQQEFDVDFLKELLKAQFNIQIDNVQLINEFNLKLTSFQNDQASIYQTAKKLTFNQLIMNADCLLKQIQSQQFSEDYLQIIFNSNQFVVISELTELQHMIDLLQNEKIISVQIKTSQQTYYNVTSFISIGTPLGVNYLIDCLELHKHIYKLRSLLLNDKILKITYDSQYIQLNLQKDFRLYLTNVFDIQLFYQIAENKHFDLLQFIELQFQHLNCNFIKTAQDAALRPLQPGQIQQLQLESYFLFYLAFRTLQEYTITQNYNSQQIKLLKIDFQETLDIQNENLLNNVNKAQSQNQLKYGVFNLFVDTIARLNDTAPNLIFDCSDLKNIDLVLVNCQQMQLSTLFRMHVPYLKQLQQLNENLYQLLNQKGNFNFQQKQYLVSAQKSILDSKTTHQQMNWTNILKLMKWDQYDKNQHDCDDMQKIDEEQIKQNLMQQLNQDNQTSQTDAKSTVEKTEIKAKKIGEILGEVSLQNVMKKYLNQQK